MATNYTSAFSGAQIDAVIGKLNGKPLSVQNGGTDATDGATALENLGLPCEVGTWTPTLYGSTVHGSVTYTKQVGVYQKIGDLVFVTFDIGVKFGSTLPQGVIEVAGLPYIVEYTGQGVIGWKNGTSANVHNLDKGIMYENYNSMSFSSTTETGQNITSTFVTGTEASKAQIKIAADQTFEFSFNGFYQIK